METKVTLVYDIKTEGVIESTSSSKKLTETLSALSSSMDLLSKKVKSFNQTAHKSSVSIRSLSDTIAKTKDQLSKYGAGLDKIAVAEKAMQTIEKARVTNMMARVREHKNLNKAIKNASSEEEKAYLMTQKQNLSLSQVKENLKASASARKLDAVIQKSANAVAKEGNDILKKYRNTLLGMSEQLDAAYFGVDKLTKVFRQQERVSTLAEKALMDYDKAIAKTVASMKGMQDGAQKSALQAKVETMEKAKARIELEKEIKLRELWKQKKNEEATIRRESAALLKIYKEQVRDTMAEVKGVAPGVDRLTESHRAENTIRKQLSKTLKAYDVQLEKVDKTLSKATDEHARNAAMMKKHELEANRSRAILHANTQVQALHNLNLRQEAVIRKDAEKALKKYNDEISKTKNRINNQVGLVKKLKEANIGLKKARMDASTMESIYADKLDKVQSELDQTTDAEKRKALQTQRNILLETQHSATIVAGASALELKRLRVRALSDALTKASQAMQRFGRIMTRYFTTVITAAIAKGVKFQAQIESQTIRFGILVRDMTKGAKLFQDIIEYSARTPFLLPELDEAAQILLAFGTPLGEVMDELRMLGDVAQGDAEKLERVATSFGKVRARGTAHMRELNRFIMSGVPIIEELNKQFGATGDQIFRMIQKNEITFDNIKKAVVEMTGESGRFHNMVEKISKTLEGRFSTAVDNLNLNLAKLVEDFTPMITHILEQFIDWSQAFRTLDSEARRSILTIAGLTAAIGPLSLAIAGAVKLIAQVVSGNYIGAIIAGLSAIASFVGFTKLKKEISSVMDKAVELKDNTNKLTKAQEYQKGMIPGLTSAMYDAAKAYGNYAFAVSEATSAEELRRRITMGEGLSAKEEDAFKILFGASQTSVEVAVSSLEKFAQLGSEWGRGIRSAFGKDWGFEGLISLKDFKDVLQTLRSASPELEKVMDNIFSSAGVLQARMTEEQANMLISEYGLVDKLVEVIGTTDMEEVNEVFLSKLRKTLANIGSAESILKNAGVDPVALQKEFATLLKISGDITIEGDVDEGLIDLSAAISRVRMGVSNLTKAYEDYKPAIADKVFAESGGTIVGISEKIIKEFENAEDDYKKGVNNYFDTLDRLISAKIAEMEYTYEEGNIFDNIFGTLDSQDMKDRIQENIKSIEDIIFSFSLTQPQLMQLKNFGDAYTDALSDALVGGEEIGADFATKFIESFAFTGKDAQELASIAPLIVYIREMQKELLGLKQKISIADVIFEQDSFILTQQIEALEEALTDALSDVDIGHIDPLSDNFAKAITLAIDDMNLGDAEKVLVERLEKLYAEAEFDVDELLSNMFGSKKDWESYLDKLAYDVALQSFKEQFLRASRLLNMGPVELMTVLRTKDGSDLQDVMSNLDGANSTLTVDNTAGMNQVEDTLQRAVLDAGDTLAEATLASGETIASAILDITEYLKSFPNGTGQVSAPSGVNPFAVGEPIGMVAQRNNETTTPDASLVTFGANGRVTLSEAISDGSSSLQTMNPPSGMSESDVNKAIDDELSSTTPFITKAFEDMLSAVINWNNSVKSKVEAAVSNLVSGISNISTEEINSTVTNLQTEVNNSYINLKGFINTLVIKVQNAKKTFLAEDSDESNPVSTFITNLQDRINSTDTTLGLFITSTKNIVDKVIGIFTEKEKVIEETSTEEVKTATGTLATNTKDIVDAATAVVNMVNSAIVAVEAEIGKLDIPQLTVPSIDINDPDLGQKLDTLAIQVNTTFVALFNAIGEADYSKQVSAYEAIFSFSKQYNTTMSTLNKYASSALTSLKTVSNGAKEEATKTTEAIAEVDLVSSLDDMRTKTVTMLKDFATLANDVVTAVENATGISLDIPTLDFSGITIDTPDFDAKINEAFVEVKDVFSALAVEIGNMSPEKQTLAMSALSGFVTKYNALMDRVYQLSIEFTEQLPDMPEGPLKQEAQSYVDTMNTMGDFEWPFDDLISALDRNTTALNQSSGSGGGGVISFEDVIKGLKEDADKLEKEYEKTQLSSKFFRRMVDEDVLSLDDALSLQSVFNSIADTFSSELTPALENFGNALATGEGFGNGFKDVLAGIMDMLPSLLISAGLRGLIDSGWSNPVAWSMLAVGGLGAILKGASTSTSASPIQEVGGNISYSASGDVFRGGYIADAPMLRKTAYGASMIGEAGDEAVMPLVRRNGVLGVQASASGTNIVVNNFSSAQVETTETVDTDGVRQVEFTIYEAVKRGLSRGEFDDSMGSSYGLSRRGYR